MHLLVLESLTWYKIKQVGEVPSPRYMFCSAVYNSKFVIFGGLNS
jgi:hypothetical protein